MEQLAYKQHEHTGFVLVCFFKKLGFKLNSEGIVWFEYNLISQQSLVLLKKRSSADHQAAL